jgi:hypothetical protein
LPAEPYGISNNPPINFGPPSLEESTFTVEYPLVPMTLPHSPIVILGRAQRNLSSPVVAKRRAGGAEDPEQEEDGLNQS